MRETYRIMYARDRIRRCWIVFRKESNRAAPVYVGYGYTRDDARDIARRDRAIRLQPLLKVV